MSARKPSKRPAGIPKRAIWFYDDGCWADGPMGKEGPIGEWTCWHRDGKLWRVENYDTRYEGTLHGERKWFGPDGAQQKVEVYQMRNVVSVSRSGQAARPRPSGSPRDAWKALEKTQKAADSTEATYNIVMRLDAAIRAADHQDYRGIAWKKVKPADLAKVEQRLKIRLPPSYVSFVTRYGLFVISSEEVDRYEEAGDGYDRLLRPSEMATITRALRRDYADFHDDPKFIKDAVCFQCRPYEDDFYVFRVSSRRKKDGELSVGAWSHDEENSWGRGFQTFDEHIAKLCKEWLKQLTSDAP
jgi:hypothetical protein